MMEEDKAEEQYTFRDNWFTRVGAWVSQGVNAIFLNGHHDQTVSSRAFLNRDKTGWKQVHDMINRVVFWEKNHCYSSYMRDVTWASHMFRTRRDERNTL